jgi:hypothetical protein
MSLILKQRKRRNNNFKLLLENVIGFRLGDFKSGSNQVVEPYCCQHISNEMKDFIKVFSSYSSCFY